ncbi:exosome complex RNA-binding protein Csl4 [Cuniculiplasma sp. SKW3]|uniref:exosome complex RNA-binding protein Csl4 n=1 Tax=unclassified Cuniculiplasma TaxID=2619706 RepID=UPI003FD2E14D
MNDNKTEYVLPGDKLSTAEEYVPGENAIEVNGDVISLVLGNVKKDDKRLVIGVKKPKEKFVPKVGDIVYGQVLRTDNRQTSVGVSGVKFGDKLIYYQADGYIRSGMDDRHSQNVKIGDIIRAKIIRVGQNLELTIHGENLGVLLTRCSRCREYMTMKDGNLYCKSCDRTENRRVPADYGSPKL